MERAKNLTEEQLIEMMDAETFLTPEQCLEYGFCDEIGGQPAEPKQIDQMNTELIRQLRQQLKEQQSFRKEMMQFAPAQPKTSQEPKETNKVLKMAGAFFDALNHQERIRKHEKQRPSETGKHGTYAGFIGSIKE